MKTHTPSSDSSTAGKRPLEGRTVSEFANVGIYTVTPDAPLDEVAWLMASNRVHAIVVAADETTEPPVIADADLVAAAGSGHFDELRARDIAGAEAVSVSEDESLDRAAQLLSEHGVSHLIVRDRRRYPTGILSTLDVARAITGRA